MSFLGQRTCGVAHERTKRTAAKTNMSDMAESAGAMREALSAEGADRYGDLPEFAGSRAAAYNSAARFERMLQ